MTTTATRVALLDYGSGNLRSAQRALERVGATVDLTSDPRVATEAEALVVPGVGAFAACMKGLEAVRGPRIIGERLAGSRPVLGICVGMQVMFDRGVEFSDGEHEDSTGVPGCGEWPGVVERLEAPYCLMGWNTVEAAERSVLFAGMPADERFYFVHSYGVRVGDGAVRSPAGARRHLGHPRDPVRGRGGERAAGRHSSTRRNPGTPDSICLRTGSGPWIGPAGRPPGLVRGARAWVAGAGVLCLGLTAVAVAVIPVGPAGRAVIALVGIVVTIAAMG